MSVRFQITVPEWLMAELKRSADSAGISVAELIRQIMQDRLRRDSRKSKGDPFVSITELVDSDETDLASRIDEVLHH
jgi:metal-responsive CopG/Arc/MetJ family transcriptional regulator